MRKGERIYKSTNPVKTAILVIFVLVITLIALAVAVFFGFKKYIVYSSDGVRLEVPWLMAENSEAIINE